MLLRVCVDGDREEGFLSMQTQLFISEGRGVERLRTIDQRIGLRPHVMSSFPL
jgi:hypothetical protein